MATLALYPKGTRVDRLKSLDLCIVVRFSYGKLKVYGPSRLRSAADGRVKLKDLRSSRTLANGSTYIQNGATVTIPSSDLPTECAA